jgi:hypothetical protein
MFPRSAVGSVVGIGGMAGSARAVLFSLSTGWVLQLTHSCTPLFVVAAPFISLAFSFSALSRQACSEWTSRSPRKTLGFETHANRLRAAVAQFARDRTRLPRGPSYSQRNTFAESAVQTTKTTANAATSPTCADHASPFQIPWSRGTA